MKTSLQPDQLTAYVARQIENAFPDGRVAEAVLHGGIVRALERTAYCFARVNEKYFYEAGQPIFNHLHSDQYAMFLYYLANSIGQMKGDPALATKVYYLNKLMHGFEVYYEINLPDIFCLSHPVGTVFGRAKFGNYFVAHQQCTVGGNNADEYPVLEEGVILYPGSSVIGHSHLGKNCIVAAGALLMDLEVPAGHIAFGRHPNVQFKPIKKNAINRYFRMGV